MGIAAGTTAAAVSHAGILLTRLRPRSFLLSLSSIDAISMLLLLQPFEANVCADLAYNTRARLWLQPEATCCFFVGALCTITQHTSPACPVLAAA
jgi:hypothetical protein